jgi:hypothetical protein
MTAPLYEIGTVSTGADVRVAEFAAAIDELAQALGAASFARLEVKPAAELGFSIPTVVVVFWDETLSPEDLEPVARARAADVAILPIVQSTEDMPHLPDLVSRLNAVSWHGGPVAAGRHCLRELGLHESARGVFISHRRSDGLEAAEQLYDAFSKAGWRVFVDRFDIDAGVDVQDRIDEALEESAFLLLLETPEASSSPWVQHEVMYALDHHLGLAIVNISDAPPFAIAEDLPRTSLAHEFHMNGSHIVLSSEAVNEIVELIETKHAAALARRRRQLLVSAMAAARGSGLEVEAAVGWRLRVRRAGDQDELVGVLPHLPIPSDLYEIDCSKSENEQAVLVHAAHLLGDHRRSMLRWMIGHRSIDLIPNNAIGARWRELA